MESPTCGSSFSSGSVSGATNSDHVEMELAGLDEIDPSTTLAEGRTVTVRIDQCSLLRFVTEYLGGINEPVFNEIDCLEEGYKYSVKLDLTGLPSLNGYPLSQAMVFGSPSFNRDTAKSSAAWKALKYLHEEHLIRVSDFSSRVADTFESYNTIDLVIAGIRSLEKIFCQWEKTFIYCENFALTLQAKQYEEVVLGVFTDRGNMFDLAGESISSKILQLHDRTSKVRDAIDKVKDDTRKFEKYRGLKAQRRLSKGHYRMVHLTSNDVLNYVLGFFEMDSAKFTIRPGFDGYVHSEVQLHFPCNANLQYSGPINISGYGATAVDANEHACYEALIFIEKNFPVKIIDCNYAKRKKATNQQDSLLTMLAKVIDSCQCVNRMWSELNHEISEMHYLFSLDPASLFCGSMSEGEIDAFKFASQGIVEIAKFSAERHDSCAAEFGMIHTMTWKMQHLKLKVLK